MSAADPSRVDARPAVDNVPTSHQRVPTHSRQRSPPPQRVVKPFFSVCATEGPCAREGPLLMSLRGVVACVESVCVVRAHPHQNSKGLQCVVGASAGGDGMPVTAGRGEEI